MNNENINKLRAWLESEEGQTCMKEVREKIEKMNKSLKVACQVTDELLRKRITI